MAGEVGGIGVGEEIWGDGELASGSGIANGCAALEGFGTDGIADGEESRRESGFDAGKIGDDCGWTLGSGRCLCLAQASAERAKPFSVTVAE